MTIRSVMTTRNFNDFKGGNEMNTLQIIGRLTKDPVIRYAGETPIASFTVAVDRHTKEKQADFIQCKAFNKTAELIEKYLAKGSQVGIEGSIQTGSYTNKDGIKVYTTDVIVEQVEFAESKNSSENSTSNINKTPAPGSDKFMSIPDGIEEELPFN